MYVLDVLGIQLWLKVYLEWSLIWVCNYLLKSVYFMVTYWTQLTGAPPFMLFATEDIIGWI